MVALFLQHEFSSFFADVDSITAAILIFHEVINGNIIFSVMEFPGQ